MAFYQLRNLERVGAADIDSNDRATEPAADMDTGGLGRVPTPEAWIPTRGIDAPEHDDVGAVSDFTEGGRGTTAFLRREQGGDRRRRRDAVDSAPKRVGDRDSGALRFARDIRSQKNQGP